ncbi:F-box/LRR-repeat protein 7-like [Ornithorhynchus anatinus]|uniref:F-box/LRR-repeat protein 7-like n=1 Tax=Ornithorhynchus anatinus TaxID=9258 RepID=UPI0019D4660D|nr:F-box/LRR-repeat protein 7-like [Ornithorhynchus anatinus]
MDCFVFLFLFSPSHPLGMVLTSSEMSIKIRLQGLSVNGCQITDRAVSALVKKHGIRYDILAQIWTKGLRKLEVFGCHALTAECLSSMALECPQLQGLNIGRLPKMTATSLAKIVMRLQEVTSLSVTGLHMVRDPGVHLIATQCPKLSRLVLSSCSQITDTSLLEISTYLCSIRHLDVSGCKKVTDTGIQVLARSCDQLCYLDLSSTRISKRGLNLESA